MNVFALVMLAAPFLLIVALVFLALVAASIRRADRRSLRDPSSNRLNAITHRLAGGVRNASRADRDR
jgi:hypothetical protein